jgi:hypothetical protein
VSAEDPGPRLWGTLAPVLTTVIAAATIRVVAVVGLSSLLLLPAHAGIQSVACVAVVAEAVMYRGRGGLPTVVRRLVDGCGLAMALGRLFPTTWGLVGGCIAVVVCR